MTYAGYATHNATERLRTERNALKTRAPLNIGRAGAWLQIAENLRPDSDHADKHRQGGERGGFLNDGFEHQSLPRT